MEVPISAAPKRRGRPPVRQTNGGDPALAARDQIKAAINTMGGVRAFAKDAGIYYSRLYAFLKGGGIKGQNLERIRAALGDRVAPSVWGEIARDSMARMMGVDLVDSDSVEVSATDRVVTPWGKIAPRSEIAKGKLLPLPVAGRLEHGPRLQAIREALEVSPKTFARMLSVSPAILKVYELGGNIPQRVIDDLVVAIKALVVIKFTTPRTVRLGADLEAA